MNQNGNIDIPPVPIRSATEWTKFVVLLNRSVLQLYRERVGYLNKKHLFLIFQKSNIYKLEVQRRINKQ